MMYIVAFIFGYLLCFAIAMKHTAFLKRRIKQADNAMFYLRQENKHLEGMLNYQRAANRQLNVKVSALEGQQNQSIKPGMYIEIEPGTFKQVKS